MRLRSDSGKRRGRCADLLVCLHGGLERVPQLHQLPLLLVVTLLDAAQLTHQVLNVAAEVLDGLQAVLEVARGARGVRGVGSLKL